MDPTCESGPCDTKPGGSSTPFTLCIASLGGASRSESPRVTIDGTRVDVLAGRDRAASSAYPSSSSLGLPGVHERSLRA